jgi:hypothetical protein
VKPSAGKEAVLRFRLGLAIAGETDRRRALSPQARQGQEL